MDSTVILLIVVIVLLLLALGAVGVMLSRKRRTERLQEHYGPEYERSVRESGDRRSAEAELTSRERQHEELDIRDLRPEERDRFQNSWADIQRGFVDDPTRSVLAADRLVTEIMRTRGYPVDDFDRRAEDISVSHPNVVQRYRDARDVREATERGDVDTDRARQAVTSYRALVEALIGRPDDRSTDDRRTDEHDLDEGRADRDDRTDRTDRGDRADHRVDEARHSESRNPDARPYADDRGPSGRQTEEHTR